MAVSGIMLTPTCPFPCPAVRLDPRFPPLNTPFNSLPLLHFGPSKLGLVSVTPEMLYPHPSSTLVSTVHNPFSPGWTFK